MKKLKEKLHLGHEQNVPPSAAQTTPYPTTTATTTTTTTAATTGVQPGTLNQPVLGTPSTTTTAYTQPGLNQPGFNQPGFNQPGFNQPGFNQPGYNQPYLGGQPATTGFSTGYAAPTTVIEREKIVVEEVQRPAEFREERFVREEKYIETGLQPSRVVDTAPVIEHRERAAVVQEVIKPGVREEIQPVVHRDREQLEIREELQPIYEKSVRPTVIEERELAPEFKPEVRTGVMPIIAEGPKSEVLVEKEHVEVMTKPAIIEETVHRKIIEDVQPVIHRETIAPKVIREVQPIYEKVIEAPVVTYTTLPARYQQGVSEVGVGRPASLTEEKVTTTVIEREFLPGSTAVPTSRPLASSGPVYPSGTVPLSSTVPATGSTQYSTSGMQNVTQGMSQVKLEEQQFGTQPPSTYQYK